MNVMTFCPQLYDAKRPNQHSAPSRKLRRLRWRERAIGWRERCSQSWHWSHCCDERAQLLVWRYPDYTRGNIWFAQSLFRGTKAKGALSINTRMRRLWLWWGPSITSRPAMPLMNGKAHRKSSPWQPRWWCRRRGTL